VPVNATLSGLIRGLEREIMQDKAD